jgi:transposase-like protein
MPRRGERDPKRERFWRRTVKAWSRSGESIRGFCADHGLTEASFHAWRRELRRRDGEGHRSARGWAGSQARSKATSQRNGVPAHASFVPVRVMAGPAPVEIERNGTTIRLHGDIDVEAIARVLDALERTAC